MIGVVVMAYGSPRSRDDVEAYYTHIRRGRPPSADELADLVRRYDAIGGLSPLRERTEAQRAALATALDAASPGTYAIALGQKHASPFIEDAVADLIDRGAESLVGVVLAPHYSRTSVGDYLAHLAAAAGPRGIPSTGVESWHDLPAWLDFHARAVTAALDGMPAATKVLFTAHSLPERVLEGDPYPDQLQQSAAAIAERAGLAPSARWGLAWQSAGRTADAWRGPDVLNVLDDLAATGRSAGVVLCPQGFTSDHLEVLYDLDVQAAERAVAHGLAFSRTRSVNDDAEVMGALAARIAEQSA